MFLRRGCCLAYQHRCGHHQAMVTYFARLWRAHFLFLLPATSIISEIGVISGWRNKPRISRIELISWIINNYVEVISGIGGWHFLRRNYCILPSKARFILAVRPWFSWWRWSDEAPRAEKVRREGAVLELAQGNAHSRLAQFGNAKSLQGSIFFLFTSSGISEIGVISG